MAVDQSPSVEQLAAMFPRLPRACVEDVHSQCQGDGAKAFESLLGMGEDCTHPAVDSPRHPHLSSPPGQQESLLAVAPWLDPQFGSFEHPAHHPPDVDPSDNPPGPQHRQWWPPGAGTLTLGPALPPTQPSPLRATSPDLPSVEGWAAAPEPALLAHTCGSGSSLSQSPPTTPLQFMDGTPVVQDTTESPDFPNQDLTEALPHLLPLFNTPSPSGTSSPVGSLALSPPNRVPCQAPSEELLLPQLLLASGTSFIEFAPELFPYLSAENVADVLSRYDDTTVAMRHLMMLSKCAAEAAVTAGSSTSAAEVPDMDSWFGDSASSSGGEETPEHPDDDLTSLEKLELLKQQFPTIDAIEVQGVLQACDDRLDSAMQLLRTFASEDATQQAPAAEAPNSMASLQPEPAPQPEASTSGDAAAKLQQLCRCFPAAAEEFVEIALQSASYDLAGAHKVLLDQGYSEVVEPELQQPEPATAALASQPAPIPTVPLPLAMGPSTSRSPPQSLDGMSLSERTYQRNQQIYEEERAHQQRLVQAKKKCRELAYQHRQRGEFALAEQLYQQAARYQEQEEQESRQASRRIGKRINAGHVESITEDLHGKHVSEVLDMVAEQIRSLPKCFSRGVQVTYITGKGLHSTSGAKLKPALMEMLADHNVPFVERPGAVVATFKPA